MQPREKQIFKVTLTGTVTNAVLIVLKFLAGFLGRSSAMVADAVHSLSDFVSDVIVLVFVKISGKPTDRSHEYGHGKFETLATLIIGVILFGAGVGLGVEGVIKVMASLRGDLPPRPAMIALVIALISIVVKEWLYRYTNRWGRTLNSKAVSANAWHHRSDAISSVGTLAGIAGAMFLGDKMRILDPIAAIVVSIFIIKSGYDIIKPCIDELLEASLPESQQKRILDLVKSVDGIRSVHKLRTRRIGNNIAVDLHAQMDGSQSLRSAHDKATSAERLLKREFGHDTIVNIHMEPSE